MEFRDDGFCSAANEGMKFDSCSLFTAFYRKQREPPLTNEERWQRASTAARMQLDVKNGEEAQDKLRRWHFEREPHDRDAFPPADTEMVFARVALWWLRQSEDIWPTDRASFDTQILEY